MLATTTTNRRNARRYANGFLPTIAPDLTMVKELTSEHTAEVQAFLAVRPVHTVVMSSFIADNGIVSELNRGKFYGYRNTAGTLEGVALIGHTTLVIPALKKPLRLWPLPHGKRRLRSI